MDKKLFFNFYGGVLALPVKLSILILFCLPMFAMASQKQTDDSEKKSQNEEKPATLFVGEGVGVVGFSNIHNAKIVKVSGEKKKEAKKVKDSTLSEEMKLALSQKKLNAAAEKKKAAAKYNEIVTRIDFNFNNSPVSNSDFKQKYSFGFQGVIPPFGFSQNFVIANYFYQLDKINTQLKKQKFYTSISYLQFKKYRNSSLRAPPQFS